MSNLSVDWMEKYGLIHNIYTWSESEFARRSPEGLWELFHENLNRLSNRSNLSDFPVVSPKWSCHTPSDT